MRLRSRPLRSYTIPISITSYYLPKTPKKTRDECAAVGTPLFNVDWDYFIDYPLGLTPEELAAALKEGKLKFGKLVPKLKPLENTG